MKSEVIAFIQKKDILPSKRICGNGHNMQLYIEGEKSGYAIKIVAKRKKVSTWQTSSSTQK